VCLHTPCFDLPEPSMQYARWHQRLLLVFGRARAERVRSVSKCPDCCANSSSVHTGCACVDQDGIAEDALSASTDSICTAQATHHVTSQWQTHILYKSSGNLKEI
jgi:hypothetical protein